VAVEPSGFIESESTPALLDVPGTQGASTPMDTTTNDRIAEPTDGGSMMTPSLMASSVEFSNGGVKVRVMVKYLGLLSFLVPLLF
jgi:hypothetical protein